MERATITRHETVAVGKVQPHPDNARRGNVARIAKSLEQNGQYRPIVVHESTGNILGGNHTYRAAVDKLGWTHIDVTYVKCTDAKAREILAMDNRASDGSSYDDEALAYLLEQIQDEGDLLAAGYQESDLDDLLAKLEEDPEVPDVAEAEPLDADVTKPARSLTEKAGTYDATATRMMVLTFTQEEFSWAVEQCAALAEKFGLETNADVVRHLIEEASGTVAP